jgi:hypothetical protein
MLYVKFGDPRLHINEYLGAGYYLNCQDELCMQERSVKAHDKDTPRQVPSALKGYVATVFPKLPSRL